MSEKPRAVVLLSGGLDSTTCCAIARDQGFELSALTVTYGQRHKIEIDAARMVAAHFDIIDHVVTNIDLRAAVDRDLSKRQRTVVLAKMAGMPSAVLADQLDTNPNAIYKLHHDARKKLRAALERIGYSAADVSSLLATASKSQGDIVTVGAPPRREP